MYFFLVSIGDARAEGNSIQLGLCCPALQLDHIRFDELTLEPRVFKRMLTLSSLQHRKSYGSTGNATSSTTHIVEYQTRE